MHINNSLIKSMVILAITITITFIFFSFSYLLPLVVDKYITVSSSLCKSGYLIFWTLAENKYTAMYAVNCIHYTWKYLFSPLNGGSRTNFVDISMFMFPYSFPSSVLSCPTLKCVGGPLYLLRLATGKLSSDCIN